MAVPNPNPENQNVTPDPEADEAPIVRLVAEPSRFQKHHPSAKHQPTTPTSPTAPTVAANETPLRDKPRPTRSGTLSEEALKAPILPNPHDSEETWGGEKASGKPLPWLWISLGILVAGALIVGGITWTNQSSKSETRRTSAAIPEPVALAKNTDQAEEETLTLVNSIESAVRGYAKATTVEDRVKYSRQPETTLPLMKAYYPDGKVPFIPVDTIQLTPITLNQSGDFWLIHLNFGLANPKTLIVENQGIHSALVDWEAEVVWQPKPWDEFAAQTPDGKSYSYRVQLQPGILYSHEFGDETQWQCYQLRAPNGEKTIYGYCKRDSELSLKIYELAESNQGAPLTVILKLKRPEGLLSPGALIESMESDNWIYVNPRP